MFRSSLFLLGALGFFSGLPLALTASTLTAWLADAGVTRSSIGLFASIATPYALKFLWAPLLDGLRLPYLTRRLGRRRSWLLLAQVLLVLSLLAMALTDPAVNPWWTALAGVAIATFSATQDSAIDAYRVELLPPEQQGSGAAWATFGYRIGMLVSGAGALALADAIGWVATYRVMAGVMALGVVVTLVAKEGFTIGFAYVRSAPGQDSGILPPPKGEGWGGGVQGAAIARHAPLLTSPLKGEGLFSVNQKTHRWPFMTAMRDFMTRPHWVQVLAFVVLYKLGDAFMGVMFNPFLLDLGFTKTQIAAVVKIYGLVATLLGTFAGGWLVARVGMYRSLLVCGFAHMLTNLLLVVQAQLGADVRFLTVSISLENFTGGMSTAAFIAYLSALCRVHYTATQYALLSSLAAFGRTWLSTPSGALADAVGWEVFFAIASGMAIPGLLLLVWLERRKNTAMKPMQRASTSLRLPLLALVAFLALQGGFWWHTRDVRPEMGIVPRVPSAETVRALSFGDEEAFFRLLALGIQNSGDTFGRFTALYKYDFAKLNQWFLLLDGLNNTSNYLPAMATYYFSQSQNPDDLRYITDYLDVHTDGRPKETWWWMVQAVYLAQHKMNDLDLALKFAKRLQGVQGIPIWAQQMPAFVHEQRGEFGAALAIIEDVARDPSRYSQGELNFMRYFVEERLGRLDAVKKEFDAIQKAKDALKAKGVPDPNPQGPPEDVGAARAPVF